MNPKDYIGPHFKYNEFRCKCSGKLHSNGIDPILVLKIEILRKMLGNNPIIIRSGYRCPSHNKKVDGAPKSQHLLGKAADIVVNGIAPSEVANMTESVFYDGGLGLYSSFTHVDSRRKMARW